MTTLREAAQQALDALEEYQAKGAPFWACDGAVAGCGSRRHRQGYSSEGETSMTNEDIIRMAREAGMERVVDVHKDGTRTIELPHPDLLKRFAALVAAAERERIAAEWDGRMYGDLEDVDIGAAIRARGNK